MFLLTLVLLLHLPAVRSEIDYDDPIPITYEDFKSKCTTYINYVRWIVATGTVVENGWGSVNPPTSKHMLRLKWSPELEMYAAINVQGCQSSNFFPQGGSLNFMTRSSNAEYEVEEAIDLLSTSNNHLSGVMPQDFNYTQLTLTLVNEVLWDWTDVLYYNITDSQGQVIYNDKAMETFANIVYYKATEVGCAVQICNNTFALAYVFNKAPQWGEPLYIANPNSNGCSTNEDCSSIAKGYYCLTSGFRQGLCSYPDDSTTTPTTTTPTTPAPGTGSSKSTGTTKATTISQSDYIIKLINEMRAKVAAGDISTLYGPLPSSLHMFQLESSPELKVYAEINTIQCQTQKYIPSGSSMNYYTFYETPGNNLNKTIVINLALATWMEEILHTNFGNQVTYTNQTLQEFANMIYYKSTKAGCAYQKCNQPAPPKAVVACIFNSAPETGKPIYLGTAGVTGCNNDGDCSSVFNGTKCGPQGLCGYSFTTTTKIHSTASTAPVTTPATEEATSARTTATPSEATSASTQGTGASSKAASHSTQVTTTPKAASTSIPEKTTASATTLQTVLTTIAATTTNQSELFIELINGFREKVAKGDLSTSNGPLPSSLQMFQVEYSPELEVYAKINTIQCQPENFTPPGSSMNYYTFYETPGENLSNITVINLALASWMQEILNTNFGSQVTYTNQNMKDFANMIYYKSTKAGCAYQECSQPVPPRAVVACIFNSAPQLGKPIYPGTQGVNGCNKDSDCSAVISGTTCGPQGLCGYSFSSTTLST